MAIRDIIRMGHPTLRQEAPIYPPEKIGSDEFVALVDDLRDTLRGTGAGIGLAAPQINVSTQVVVLEINDPITRYGEVQTIPFSVYVNPVISVLDDSSAGYWEGCLSVPDMMGFVERPQHIQVDYLDELGEARSIRVQGFLATVFQHEFDHLHGTLYVDKIKDMSLFSYQTEYQLYHNATS